MAYTLDVYGQLRRIADSVNDGSGDGGPYTDDRYGQVRRIADVLGPE